jgi:hypothetical protein
MTSLAKDLSFLELFIVNTVVYFDLFDYPLTANEIFHYLYTGGMVGSSYTLLEIEDNLKNNPKLKKIITEQGGFYFLKKRQEIIKIRLQRYGLAENKFKIVLRALRLIKFLPFIKFVGICNSLAYRNAKKESDLDLFIITTQGRLWLTRLVLILLITILGLRPPKHKVQDKLCLSFYTTENYLDLAPIKILTDDIYLIYWLATLMPVYEQDNFYDKFVHANSWLKKYLPNWQPKVLGYRYRVEDSNFSAKISRFKEKFLGKFLGDKAEKWAYNWQYAKMSQKKKDLAVSKHNWVVINDKMLKLHENDRRQEYLDKFEARRKEVIEQI